MSEKLQIRVLDVKSLTEYIVREEQTIETERYAKLEDLLQKTYSVETGGESRHESRDELEIGSYCAAYVQLWDKRSPKRWLRAVIKNIFQAVGGFLYSIYLVDYGLEKCCQKSSIRELKPHLSNAFVNFQAFSFNLYGIESEKGIKSREVINFIKAVFHDNNNIVLAHIHSRDKYGSALGSIILSNGLDLATVFIERQFGIDKCGHSRKSYSYETNGNNHCIDNTSVRKPHSSPFIRSADNSYVISPEHMEHIKKSPPKAPNNVSLVRSAVESQKTTNNHQMNGLNGNQTPKAMSTATTSNGMRSKKLMDLLKDIKRNKDNASDHSMDESLNGAKGNASERYYDLEIEGDSDQQMKEEDIDWPYYEANGFVKLKPAGCQPPPEVMERIFTLKRN